MGKRSDSFSSYSRTDRFQSRPGHYEVVDAFAKRDVQALNEALARHPGAWQTDIYLSDSESRGKADGLCAHMAAYMNWSSAFSVLHAHGDPLDTPHPETDRTPMQIAVSRVATKAVKGLLRLGIPPDLTTLRRRDGVSMKSHRELIDVLVAAGADPWQEIKIRDDQVRLLPLRHLDDSQFGLAVHLASRKPLPGYLSDRAFEVANRFADAWYRAPDAKQEEHRRYYDLLASAGVAPPVSALAFWLDAVDRDRSAFPSIGSKYEELCGLIAYACSKVPVAEVADVLPLLEKQPLLARTVAELQTRILEETTPQVSSSIRHGMRL